MNQIWFGCLLVAIGVGSLFWAKNPTAHWLSYPLIMLGIVTVVVAKATPKNHKKKNKP